MSGARTAWRKKLVGAALTLGLATGCGGERAGDPAPADDERPDTLTSEEQQAFAVDLDRFREMQDGRLDTVDMTARGDDAAFHVQILNYTDEFTALTYAAWYTGPDSSVMFAADDQPRLVDDLGNVYRGVVIPDNPRVEVESEGYPAQGPADAPVTIVEFSDFECPFCSRVVPTLERVKEEYGDKVRLVFRHFPLSMHPNAPKAAEASMCAHDQGKFWQMHDLMFEEQKQLSVVDLKSKAERLELDTEQFNQCLDSDKYADEVQQDMQAGQQAGVTGTPAMFVNGRLVSGAVPFEQIAPVIDSELARAKGNSGS